MRTRWGFVVVSILLVTAAAALAGGRHRGSGMSISVHSWGEPRTCGDLDIRTDWRFDKRAEYRGDDPAVARGEQRLSVPRASTPLQVGAVASGGVVVRGWEGQTYEVVVCKAVVASSGGEAALGEISVRLEGSRLVTTGPDDREWLAYLLIRAPRDANMQLTIENGPLSVEDASGQFAIDGRNGPVSLRGVSGRVTADIENGPIDISGGSGDMRVRTQNGPIAVHLEGADWNGAGLEARAINGPLDLEVDPGYEGAVLVESSGHSPWDCGELCRRGERSWDDGSRRFQLGRGPARVRLFTENGPVAIGSK